MVNKYTAVLASVIKVKKMVLKNTAVHTFPVFSVNLLEIIPTIDKVGMSPNANIALSENVGYSATPVL